MLTRWLGNEPRETLICAVTSAVALVLSFTGAAGSLLPFDIAWAAIILCGIPILTGAFKGVVFAHDIKADLLVSLALIASVATGEFFAAGEVALIMQIGSLLEDYTSGKAREGIEKLIRISPQTARVLRDGTQTEIPVEEVKVGNIISVIAGETVPVDGTILEGETSIDQSVMTGESIPADKSAGDKVFSGTVNQYGTFTMRADSVSRDSSLQRMVRLAEEAEKNKAPVVTAADRWATWLVVIALSCAVITWLVTGQFMRAVTVLVVFCPCAFILATPTAVLAGIGNAAKYGIIVRSGDALERLSKIKRVAFDKTGTLTKGVFEVTGVHHSRISDEKLLELAALAESASSHPISKSLQRAYGKTLDRSRVTDIEERSGRGVVARVDGHTVAAGNSRLMDELGIAWIPCHKVGTLVHMAVDGEYAGHILISDVMKENSPQAVQEMQQSGIECIMLTGDGRKTAEDMARRLGIHQVYSELMPEDKVAKVEEIIRHKGKKEKVLFVGDGINDAPVLSVADVGVAMGAMGSDAAIEAADVVLMDDDPLKIGKAIRISRKCMRIVMENIIFAIGIKVICMVLGALGLANIWMAIFADTGVLILAVLNAMRALFVGNV